MPYACGHIYMYRRMAILLSLFPCHPLIYHSILAKSILLLLWCKFLMCGQNETLKCIIVCAFSWPRHVCVCVCARACSIVVVVLLCCWRFILQSLPVFSIRPIYEVCVKWLVNDQTNYYFLLCSTILSRLSICSLRSCVYLFNFLCFFIACLLSAQSHQHITRA